MLSGFGSSRSPRRSLRCRQRLTAILGRFLQGSGAACLMPATMAILRIAYPPERQGFALGIWGAVGGVAFAVGPLIGGVLTDAVSWRWLWWLTVIAGAPTGSRLRVLRGMPAPPSGRGSTMAGMGLLALWLFA